MPDNMDEFSSIPFGKLGILSLIHSDAADD